MFDFLTNKFTSIFSVFDKNKYITEDNIHDVLLKVHDALLQADVPYDVVQAFMSDIKQDVVGKQVIKALQPGEQLVKIVHDRLKVLLGDEADVDKVQELVLPATIMVMGLQGSGKTTTTAKIAFFMAKRAEKKNKKQSILVASVDFYRPAAIDQLEVVARQAHVAFYRSSATDPIKAAMDIQQYARKNHFDLLILDTAGRLHVDNPMLQELCSIDTQIRPRYKWLVLDSMTGQESLNIAQTFDQKVGFDHAIMSKMDSDSRGGAAFSFRYVLRKSIAFIGIGEKVADLELFYPDRVASRILGMGDLASLAEKADEKIKQSEQEAVYASFMSGNFSLQDFAKHMDMMSTLGSMTQLLRYIPGMGSLNVSPDMIEKGEQDMKLFRAIINSMTPKERLNPAILNPSRKKRIAQGAGVQITDVNQLLQRFEQSKQYVKLFKKFGKF